VLRSAYVEEVLLGNVHLTVLFSGFSLLKLKLFIAICACLSFIVNGGSKRSPFLENVLSL
jgi:hypothetical protein